MNASGAASLIGLAAAESAAPGDLPTRVPPGRSHLEYLLREVHGNLAAERPDVAVTNLCHAIRVAVGCEQLSDAEDALLRLVDRDHGGFL